MSTKISSFIAIGQGCPRPRLATPECYHLNARGTDKFAINSARYNLCDSGRTLRNSVSLGRVHVNTLAKVVHGA